MNRKHKRIHSNKPLSYRQQLLKEFKEKYPYYNFKSNLLAGIFIIGVSLTVWEINIYRETFIPLYTTLSIWILPSLITTPLFKRLLIYTVLTLIHLVAQDYSGIIFTT